MRRSAIRPNCVGSRCRWREMIEEFDDEPRRLGPLRPHGEQSSLEVQSGDVDLDQSARLRGRRRPRVG